MERIWNWLVAVVLAWVLGELILAVGGLPPALFLFGNLKFLPSIPWLLPATAVWLWAFWRYLNGAGWPSGTADARRRLLRARKLDARVWRWSLLAGGLGMVSAVGLSFLTARLAGLPRSTFKPSIDLASHPSWMVASAVLAISVVAGVVEEAAFRGVLLSVVQARLGWLAGILVSGLAFFVAHRNHAYVTMAFLPFFLAVSALHCWLVYLTRSIRPSIVLHTAADLVILPIQIGAAGEVDPSLALCLGLLFVPAIAALPAFRRLASVAGSAPSSI